VQAASSGSGGSGDASQATLLQVKAKTDLITGFNVTPISASTPSPLSGSTITAYIGGDTTLAINSGATITGMTLRFVIEDMNRNDVLVIEDASITKGGDGQTYTVTIPKSIAGSVATYYWSLRDVTSSKNTVINLGVLSIEYAALKDA
jgi:hypothetical protein